MPHAPFAAPALRLLIGLLLASAGTALAQDPLVGSFSDGQLLLVMQGGNGQYSGQISFQGQTYPFAAQGSAQLLDGSFQVGADRFPFQAGLQGETLIFVTSGQTYQLQRQAAAAPPPAAAAGGPLGPGVQLTYSQAVASHPGAAAGPDARGTGGEGYIVINVAEMTERGCVANVSNYSIHILDRTLSNAGGGPLIDQEGGCGEYWLPPATLQAMPDSNDGTTSVQRSPYSHRGQEFQALFITTALQGGYRTQKIYDTASGLMLAYSEGTGAMNWGAGDAQVASSSGVNELLSVRQVSLPWATNTALSPQLQQLQQLRYQGAMVDTLPGIVLWDASVETGIDIVMDVQQRAANHLLMRTTNTFSMMGIAMTPSTGAVVISAGSGYYVPPAALAGLQPGQVLDQHPDIGLRVVVEADQQGRIALVTQGNGYTSRGVYDLASGLLVASISEVRDSSKITVTTVQLVGSQ